MIAFFSRSIGGANGADRLGADMALGLVSSGLPVTVVTNQPVTPADMSPDLASASPERIRFLPLPSEPAFPTTVDRNFPKRAARWLKWKVLDARRRTALRAVNPDLTVVNDLGSHDGVRRSGIRSPGPSLLIVNQSPRHFGPPYQAKPLEWALARMREYSSFVFVSSRCRDEWAALGATADKPVFRVPNCCDESEVRRLEGEGKAAVRRRLDLPPDRLVAMCVATLQHRKGQDILVDQFPRLAEVAPDLVVHFVGAPVSATDWVLGSVEYAHRIRDAARESAYADRMVFTGSKRNALEYIYAADLLLLPARAEAMPLTVLEAMALGTPVIASDVDGIPEMIVHGTSGLLFDPARPTGLIDAVATLARSPATRDALAARARERYWSHFSRDLVRRGYGQVVEALLAMGLIRAPGSPAAGAPRHREGS